MEGLGRSIEVAAVKLDIGDGDGGPGVGAGDLEKPAIADQRLFGSSQRPIGRRHPLEGVPVSALPQWEPTRPFFSRRCRMG